MLTNVRKDDARGARRAVVALLLCALALCAGFFVPNALASDQDNDLMVGTVDYSAGGDLQAQAIELPDSWNFIVNERGQRFATLQAAIDATQGKETTITLNGGDRFHSYGDVFIRGGKNVTIKAGDTYAIFNMKIDIIGGSLTIEGTSKNRIWLLGNLETYSAAVTFKYCDIYRTLKQDRGSLRLENCKLKDLSADADKANKAMIALAGNATCSLKDTKINGDIYVDKGCTVTEVDGATIVNQGYRTGNGITVEGGGALRSVKNSTIMAAYAAIELRDGSTGPTIESTNLFGYLTYEIAVKGTVSGLKIEPSLEGSGKGMGSGGYYTKVNTTNPLWILGVVPNGYQLSRWTKNVQFITADDVTSTQSMRYLVRTDCSVTYDANGGSGNMTSWNRSEQWADMSLTVASNQFTYEGAKFTGWNTKADGTGKAYQPGQTLTFDSQYQVTLYAQWDNPTYTVTFDSQGGSAVSSQRVRKGGKIKRPENPTRDDYVFNGWFTGTDYTSRYEFDYWTVNENKTLYARWKKKKHQVFFESNGGQVFSPQPVEHGSKAYAPYNPTRAHYELEGWYADSDLKTLFDFEGTPITADVTVYAKWGNYENCHVWSDGGVTQVQTCTQDEITTKTCNADPGHTHIKSEKTKDALGHEPGKETRENDVAPTCTANGKYDLVVYCTRAGCGEELWRETVIVPALGHDWSTWAKVKDATYEEEGQEKCTCTRCGTVQTRAIPKLEHTHHLVHVDAHTATCTDEGNIGYWECVNDGDDHLGCGKWFLDKAGTQEVPYFDATVDEGGVVIESLGHVQGDPMRENIVESTCAVAGSHDEVVYCTECKQELKRTHVLDPLLDEHTPDTPAEEEGLPATCESNGYHYMVTKCKVCKKILSGTYVEDPAFGHDWDSGRIAAYPTCLTPGTKIYTCKHDSTHTKREAIPATGHTPGQPVQENVHESDGCMDKPFHDDVVYCLTCGAEISRTRVFSDPPGHTESEQIVLTDDPTCTEDGLMIRKTECTVCGHELTYEEEVIEALGHEPDEETRENDVAPTCLKDGSYELVVRCAHEDCDEELWRETVIVPALGHDWSTWAKVKDATYEEEGQEKCTCTRCGTVQTRAIPKLEHTHHLVHVDAHTATCTDEGNIGYWECVSGEGHVGCGKWFLDEAGTQEVPYFDATVDEGGVVIESLGHVRGYPVREKEKAATCSATGSYDEVVKCTREGCNHELSRITKTIPKTAHTEATKEIAIAEQTCEHEGKTQNVTYCSVCDKELHCSETIKPALGHEVDVDAESYENIVEPTCTEDGSYDEVMYCRRCDEELYRIKEAESKLGHDWDAWKVVTSATDYLEGQQKRTCARCGEVQTRAIPTLTHVHNLVRVDAQPATCADEGNVEYWECVNDGKGHLGCGKWFLDEAGTEWAEVLDFDATVDEGGICVPQTSHVPGQIVNEVVKEATCTDDGLHNEVLHCANEACNHTALSTTSVVDQAKGHTPSEVQHEHAIEATCTEGGYDFEYVECTTCGEELSLEPVETEPTDHTPGDPVRENVVEPTTSTDGSYDKVVYCSVCNQELSREKVVIPALDEDPVVKYLVVEGDGATWVQGSKLADQGLRFVFKRSEADDQTFSHFLGIRVDDDPVAESNYTAEPGSVVITLPPSFLETLPAGDHTLTALFDDGAAVNVSFTVQKPEDATDESASSRSAATKGTAKSPSTGDNLLKDACSALLVIAPAACALTILAFRKRRDVGRERNGTNR